MRKAHYVSNLIKVLMVEDSITDAELIQRELIRGGLSVECRRVETRAAFEVELERFPPNLILSDFSLPHFDGLSALKLAHAIFPDVPFIFVSGTIDEDTAIGALRGGAIDYVSKNNLKRLSSAVTRALDDVQTRAARVQAESRFRDFLEFAPNAIVVINEHGTIEFVNACTETMFGYERRQMLGHPYEMLIPDRIKELHEAFKTNAYQGLQVAPTVNLPIKGRRKNGTEFPAEINLSPLRVESGMWVSGVIQDISQRKSQEKRIARLHRIQMVLSNINAAGIRIRERDALCKEACEIAVKHGKFGMAWIGMIDQATKAGNVIAWSGGVNVEPSQIRLTADMDSIDAMRPASQAIRQKAAIICNNIQADPVLAAALFRATESGYKSMVALPLVVNGEAIGVIVLYAKDTDFFNQDEMTLLNQLAADISFALEHQQNQDRLNYLVYFDSVTNLPNRVLFQDRLKHLIEQNEDSNAGQIAVVLIDIDRFRNINDTLGRNAGNLLLKEIGRRLGECTAEPEYVARIDANCFAIAVKCSLYDVTVIDTLQQRLSQRIAEPVGLFDRDIRISFKVGIAIYPPDGRDGETLLRNAEAALHNAKISRLSHLFYDLEMNARSANKLSLENRLRLALEKEQFILEYQPKIDLTSGKLTGLEALIRWNEPGHRLIQPGEFIPVLEETGLIVEVGAWVISQAHRQYKEWALRGLMPPRIAVNVSQLQIRQKNFVSQFLSLMAGAYQEELEIEITESLFMEDLDENIEKLAALRRTGITVAIDDFGTGYSSLSYIARLPIDTLKIDRSFITDMGISADHMAIISTIISLAHALNLTVVAEGVETAEQSHLLKLLRCDQIQGFVYRRPLPVTEIEALLVQLAG